MQIISKFLVGGNINPVGYSFSGFVARGTASCLWRTLLGRVLMQLWSSCGRRVLQEAFGQVFKDNGCFEENCARQEVAAESSLLCQIPVNMYLKPFM